MGEPFENDNKPKAFKALISSSNFWKPALGALIGGIVGFLYYFYIGCSSGTCGITSNPFSSVLMGSALGYFLLNTRAKPTN